MIGSTIEWSIRHRGAVVALGLAFAIWGSFEAWNAPVDAIPDLSENQVLVFAEWRGHSPRELEDQVTYPLSVALQGIKGVKVVRSSSEFNFCLISVIFEESVATGAARERVEEGLARANEELPEGVAAKAGPDASPTGQIFWYTVEGKGIDPGRLRAIQDWYIKPQLASVPGVAEVASVGGAAIEYQVNLLPDRLLAEGISLDRVVKSVEASNGASGGHVVTKGNAEFLVRGDGRLGARSAPSGSADFDPAQAIRDLENAVVGTSSNGSILRVGDLATVSLGARSKRGVLEKDGNEVSGGVVLMARSENPLEVTRRIKAKIKELRAGLPEGARIVPFYDRTPLIQGAIGTLTRAVIEAMVTATICVLLILLHLRATLVIALTLPLSAIGAFAVLGLLRRTGLSDIPINIMSLAGIAISIGVLVDSSIVITENAMHALRERFGDEPARGDLSEILIASCRNVGRPIFYSILIMLLSFLPVFALGGLDGKMFRPLAITKCLALLIVAGLAVTLVPALASYCLKGRIRSEESSWLVRTVAEVYRPVLSYSLDHPGPLVWILVVTSLLGLAPLGIKWLSLTGLFLGLIALWVVCRSIGTRIVGWSSLVLLAAMMDRGVAPLPMGSSTPIDEGMIMDMPISVPGASVSQATDDLKARDMILCRFPEVDMVVGKAGRAETPTDPAPMDMIETMVNLRPREFWPRRVLGRSDAEAQASRVLDAMMKDKIVEQAKDSQERDQLINVALDHIFPLLEITLREHAYQRFHECDVSFGGPINDPEDPRLLEYNALIASRVPVIDDELRHRAAGGLTRLLLEEFLILKPEREPLMAEAIRKVRALRERDSSDSNRHRRATGEAHHAELEPDPEILELEPQPRLDAIQTTLADAFEQSLTLWKRERAELIDFGGELDRAVQMPGWTNVWTRPIQNRVDMLATGINTSMGVRVLGRTIDDVSNASERIAEVIKRIRGTADVIADPIRGKGYVEVRLNRENAMRLGVTSDEVNSAVEIAIAGKDATIVQQGRERHPVRVRLARDFREDDASIRAIPVAALQGSTREFQRLVPLADVARVSIVSGPSSIKSENGLLRNYVRLNVRGRSAAEVMREADTAIAAEVKLPEGTYFEWTGQFQSEAETRRTLTWIIPLALGLIFGVLYWTYRDLADACLLMLAVPGALAGGVIAQWLRGEPFTVTVWIGYIACFGMATSTGIIMLVYLREAVRKSGEFATLSEPELRLAVLNGATQRLRPKLLTEGTVLLGLGPMLWASGVGSEVVRPMIAPVIGGLLIADEVIDLLIPVLFYRIRLGRLSRHSRKVDGTS